MNEPPWAEQCRQCVNLKLSYNGRHWRCRALRSTAYHKVGWCADARAPGAICGPEGNAFQPKQGGAE